MSAIVIEGRLVHYEAFGRGQPILFLHGWLGSWRYWVSTMEALTDKYRTYALDLWGFGDSDKSKDQYQIVDYVALVDNFIQAIGLRQITLVGHALGAVVMLEYAARYPEQVEKMVAVSLPFEAAAVNRSKFLAVANNSLLTRLLWWRSHLAYEEVQAEADKASQQAIQDSLHAVSRIDIGKHLQTLGQATDIPLLIVYGDRDDLIVPPSHNTLNGQWPNIRTIHLPDAQHFPMLDDGAKFQRLLKEFLELNDDLSVLTLKEEWRRRTR